MRLQATIDIFLPGDTVVREPTFWERMRRAFGGRLDLDTDRTRVAIEATALVDQARGALRRLGIANGVALVIDDQVVFQDTEGRPDDLGDLVLALGDHTGVFGAGFRSLRFAVEHEEGGLHSVVETEARTEHRRGEPTAIVRVGARARDLEPRPGEDAEAYRQRVTPLAADTQRLEGYRLRFEAEVARLADALRVAFPQGRVAERKTEARVVKPQVPALGQEAPKPVAPGHPAYDPYLAYYRSPFEGMLSALLIGSFLSSAFHPHVTVVHPSGAPIAPAGELAGHQADLAPDAPDPGAGEGADLEAGDAGEAGEAGDLGDAGESGELADLGEVGGGDAGGDLGDLGGGDFGDFGDF